MRLINTILIDEQDSHFLEEYNWKQYKDGYISCTVRTGDSPKRVFLHRLINNTPKGLLTDHINGNKLDNRQSNLRSVTHTANMRNRSINKNNSTGVSGVFYSKSHGIAGAVIATARINGKAVNKKFGCLKMGYNEAFRKAVEWRKLHELKHNITPRKAI